MADTNSLIRFRFGTFQSIKDLGSKNQTDIYFASDSPTFYNAGLWYGVSSLTSSVNEETGEVTLTINGDLGEDWKGSQPGCTFVAGMTTEQKDNLKMVVDFVNSITTTEGEDTQTVIDKWNEIINFLEGFKDTDVLLDRIVTLETNVTNLQNTTINAGDGLKGGGNLKGNRTIALGTPSTITDSSTNSVTTNSHTHAIDEASTEQRGIVRLNDTLTSDNTDQALTAKQGKVLKEHIDEMFELIDKGNGVKEIKAKYGLWSDSFISARGVDNESSGVGGLDAQAVWDLLMQNDDATKVINIAHIPDITVAKITDFTAKVGDLIANKADKATTLAGYGITDGVTTNTDQTITGVKTFSNLRVNNSTMVSNLNAEMVGGVSSNKLMRYLIRDTYLSAQLIGEESKKAAETFIEYWGTGGFYNSKWGSVEAINGFKGNLTGNADTATNADKLDGLHAKDFVKYFVGTSVAEVQSSSLGYGQTEFGSKVNGLLLTGLYLDGKYGGQINGNTAGTELYYRGKTGSRWTTWKQLAFTDTNSLTPNGGTLTVDGDVRIKQSLYFSENAIIKGVNGTNLLSEYSGSAVGLNTTNYDTYIDGKIIRLRYAGDQTAIKIGEDGAIDLNTPTTIHAKLTATSLAVNSTSMVTNLNADTLDGYHATSFGKVTEYDLTAGSILRIDMSGQRGFLISTQGTNTERNALYFVTGYGYGTTSRNSLRVIKSGPFDVYFNGESESGCVYIKYNGDTIGPDKLYIHPFGNEGIASGVVSAIPSDAVLVSTSNRNIIATLGDNVASATKLETPRTIWGQQFDGTNNVSGALYLGRYPILGNDNINILNHSASGYFELGYGVASEGYSTYINGNSIHFCYSTEHKTGILLSSNGNVAIGAVSSAAKLHVDGDSIINGNLTVANQLTIGNATLYWDVANQCLRVNSGIASDSFLSAKGIDTTGNGQGGGGFDAQMMWQELTVSSPTNAGKVIDPLFLPMEEIYSPISETFNALEKRVAALEKALTWQTL